MFVNHIYSILKLLFINPKLVPMTARVIDSMGPN